MRRGNFLIVIGVAIITWFTLTAFLGRRHGMGYHRWRDNYYGRCYRSDSSLRGDHYYRHDRDRPSREQESLPDSIQLQK